MKISKIILTCLLLLSTCFMSVAGAADKKSDVRSTNMKHKILLIATGGTIACVPSEDGLVPGLDGEELLKQAPLTDAERANIASVTSKEILNLDSSNVQPEHWQLMAQTIADNYDDYDGFVITHGTDTMAYSAAAVSQMLTNVQKPVVFTGAQLSMIEEGSDAPHNLRRALVAASSNLKGVALAFDNVLINGSAAHKIATLNFTGFASINREPLAVWQDDAWQASAANDVMAGGGYGQGEFKAATALEPKIAIVKIIPGLSPDVLEYYADRGYKGIVIEGFGAGGVPNEGNNWMPTLERVLKKGVKVVCATQCLYDGVHLDTYPMGILAERLGAESAGEATIEASTVKLMWDLANK